MINIVIPMAGRGSRFQKEGYKLPKPLIPIHGHPMIEVVINNLRPAYEHRFIFLCLKEHLDEFKLDSYLRNLSPGCQIIIVDKVTEGAACTVLLAKEYINNNDQLMIANCDQWVDIDINKYLAYMDDNRLDGLIMTMWADDPKWSFVGFDANGKVCEVVEKQVVSNEATVGIYNYRQGKDFVTAAESMIAQELKVNNEFYVAPAYDEMIKAGFAIGVYNVGKVFDGMYGLGIPEDLNNFINDKISMKAIKLGG